MTFIAALEILSGLGMVGLLDPAPVDSTGSCDTGR